MRQCLTNAVDILRAAVERLAAGAGIIIGNAAARLHRDRGEAVVVERQPGDMMRAGKGGLDHIDIPIRIVKEVLLAAPSWTNGAPGRTASPASPRGQHLVIDRHQLRRVARQCFRRGDDDGNALTDIAHAILRQRRKLGAEALRPAHVLGHELGVEGAEPVGCPILAGQDGVNTG